MGDEKRERRWEELKRARKLVRDTKFCITCDEPDATLALIRIVKAIRENKFQLFQLSDFVDRINTLASDHREDENYLKVLEEIVNAVKECC